MATQTKHNSPSIDNFVGQLVEDKGLGYLEPEVLEQVKQDLAERVEERVNAVVLEKMPPDKLEFFEKLLERSNQDEIQSFCARNIPDIDKAIAAELVEFRKTYLNL